MMAFLHQTGRILWHFFAARGWRGHGVHSPYVYRLARHVLPRRFADKALARRVGAMRGALLRDRSLLRVLDLGTGGAGGAVVSRTVRDIARRAGMTRGHGLLLSRLAQDALKEDPGAVILELGTSLGISTAYLSGACPQARVLTVDAAAECQRVAREALLKHGFGNVTMRCGAFEEFLPGLLEEWGGTPCFVFVDGNHTRTATLRYASLLLAGACPGAVTTIVFDDINLSPQMTEAWRAICADSRVANALDLGRFGVALVRPGAQKECYVLRW